MTNIALTLSYDGTDFCGWQRQDKMPQLRTVQGKLEEALEKMLRTHVDVQGSGRTDSGVHAKAQVCNFISPVDSVPVQNYVKALNGLLPKDIRISRAEIMDRGFSSRFNATSRIYHYFMQTINPPLAHQSRYVWYLSHRPDVDLLNSYVKDFHGETDCKTFAAAGDHSLSTCRYIDNARFWYEDDVLVFEIEANAFLWKMVRSITGTLIGLEKSKSPSDSFMKIVKSCERSNAGVTAPPDGLFLWDVKFNGIRRHI